MYLELNRVKSSVKMNFENKRDSVKELSPKKSVKCAHSAKGAVWGLLRNFSPEGPVLSYCPYLQQLLSLSKSQALAHLDEGLT